MKAKENPERGLRPENTGGGVVFPSGFYKPHFYKPDTAAPFLALFKSFSAAHAPAEWVKDVRYGALTALEQEGLPTPVLERWKYSNLPPRLRGLPKDYADADMTVRDPEGVAQSLAAAYQDTPDWLVAMQGMTPPGHERYGDMMLWHLSNAFLTDGVLVDIPAGRVVDKPLEITVSGQSGLFSNPRAAIRLGAGARLTVIEYHRGAGQYWTNGVTQIEVGHDAVLYHYRLQDAAPEAVHTQATHVTVAGGGRYESMTLTSGADFSRHQAHVELQGPGAHVTLNALNLLRGTQHGDSTFLVEHQAPGCTSSQTVRSVLDNQARGVFQGKVHVHQAGQRTDGYQLCNTLILSEGAEMDTKPELEIYADDVKCSHGATTGQVDDEALFYLRSRGIPERAARALLIEGFLAEVVESVHNENVQAAALGKIREWLKGSG